MAEAEDVGAAIPEQARPLALGFAAWLVQELVRLP
jgi:hypothetical protein